MDFTLPRQRMVEEQLIPRGISTPAVIEAFKRVERHQFVPGEYLSNAYDDCPLPIGKGQTISQPYIVALMTEILRLRGNEKVLEIGTGSGYQTAILAELSKEVYSMERIPELAEHSSRLLRTLGYKNITIKVGDGSLGWGEHEPFDAIIITASCPETPETLLKQMAENGRLVAPIGAAFGQVLTLFRKKDEHIYSDEICGCMFVPLVGKEGWKER